MSYVALLPSLPPILASAGVLMLVVSVVVGANGRCAQQCHSGQGSEQQALHRVFGSPPRVWTVVGWVPCVLRVVTDLPITAALQPALLTP